MRIVDLWISAEHWAAGQWRPADDIVDIRVTLQDRTQWTATVCSFAHVETLRTRWSASGECLGGQYLWAANLLLVTDTSRATITAMLEDLLASGEFTAALAISAAQ